jgi:hypothetical protein
MTIDPTAPARLCLVVALLLCSSARAFGPRFEPVNGRLSRKTPLRARDNNYRDDGEDSLVIEAYRSKLQNRYDPYHGGHLDEMAFVREKADNLATDFFAETFDVYPEEPCGDDCEECAIPEDWKTLSGSADQIDVMQFLGIRRAEPLLKAADWE